MLAENYDSVVAARDMKESLERQDSAGLFVLWADWDRALPQMREHRLRFDAAYRRAAGNITEPGEAEILQAIGAARDEYYRRVDRFLRDAKDERLAAPAVLRALAAPKYFSSSSRCSPSCAATAIGCWPQSGAMRRKAAEAATLARRWFVARSRSRWRWSLCGSWFAILLSNRIVRPVRQLTDAASRMAAGDLDAVVDVRSGDEIGVLAARFNAMAARIRELRQSDLGKSWWRSRRPKPQSIRCTTRSS